MQHLKTVITSYSIHYTKLYEFPEAFIGTMGGLLKKIEDPEYNYVNSVSDRNNFV